MDAPDDWPFEDAPNIAVITTQAVLDGAWIARASIDEEDGGWQFHALSGPREEEGRVVSLRRIYQLDPTIADLADLPLGGRAWRTSPGAAWERDD